MKVLGLLAVLAFTGLTACAPEVAYNPTSAIVTPAGKQGFTIQCDSNASQCYQWAGWRCPDGYAIINDTQSTVNTWSFNRFGGGSESHRLQTMIVECKGEARMTW